MTRKFRVVMTVLMGAVVAVALLMGAGRLFASPFASSAVPEIVNYQGFLTDAGGVPISGSVTLQFSIWDASSAGSQLWNETHNNVPVSGGYFSVLLGSQGTPLTPSVFSSPSRYLEVTYNGTTFARQRLASVPYALVAQQAQQASEAITSTYATTSTYAASSTFATTATYALNGPGGGAVAWSHVVVVAKSGGDYTTVNDAMNAISPSSTERYLVLVMPGVYEEEVSLKEYVHLKGAGIDTTFITSQASDGNFNNDAAATMLVPANAQISNLTVRNDATTDDSIAVKILSGNSETILDTVGMEVAGAGGDHHISMYLNAGSPALNNARIRTGGATVFNRGVFNSASSPTIQDSSVVVTGTSAEGWNMNGGNPLIRNTVISGKNGTTGKGIAVSAAGGTVSIDHSSILGDLAAGGFAIQSTNNVNFNVGASLLFGAVFTNGNPAQANCAANYNNFYNPLNGDCQ